MDTPRKRPMAPVRRLPLFRRQVIERLSPAGVDACLQAARRISEGQIGAQGRYFGATYFTIDLGALADTLREPPTAATAAQLARRLGREVAVKRRLTRIAVKEAADIAGVGLATPVAEVRVRAEGRCVLIDVDLEATVVRREESAGGRA